MFEEISKGSKLTVSIVFNAKTTIKADTCILGKKIKMENKNYYERLFGGRRTKEEQIKKYMICPSNKSYKNYESTQTPIARMYYITPENEASKQGESRDWEKYLQQILSEWA